ncbi:MAG: protein kinase [Micrococcales bacterium]|nr:protein kinase [Micrococcales bacterium]MCL2667597.1 protein kinase [Micrococcales bacterium]
MLSGDVLSRWLQARAGTVVAGSLVRLSPSGLLRVSTTTDSHRVQVALPVAHGGQAAVSRAVPDGRDEPSLALRVQAVSSEQEKARQMERLVAMLTVAEAARADTATYPAVLPVHESFVVAVSSTEIGMTGPTTEHELWCDVMAWCPRNLADHHREAGPAARDPRTVTSQILPVMATVCAVHDNLNIVHRDITPANVLVDDAGRLLLADWGIAHTVPADRTSTHTQMVGNRGFSLPPEMLAGNSAVGRYTDAWYLGSLAVWMLTGSPPGPWGELPPLPGGPDGARLAFVAQGLCQPDPRRRLDLATACQQLSALAVSPATAQVTGPPVTGGAPSWSTPTATFGAAPSATAPPPPYGTAPPTGAQRPGPSVADRSEWSAGPQPSDSRKAVAVAVAALVAVLVVGVVGVALWLARMSSTPQATPQRPPASTPASPSPSPSETPDDEDSEDPAADEPDYPPFAGLAAARAAVPLVDNPTCTQVDPTSHVPRGAQEVFACSWSGIRATVYITRWNSAAQGGSAWANLSADDVGGVLVMNSGTWTLNDDPRGPSFTVNGSASRPSTTTLCYTDLPYCCTVEYGDSYEYQKAESRLGLLSAAKAADLVASWQG